MEVFLQIVIIGGIIALFTRDKWVGPASELIQKIKDRL